MVQLCQMGLELNGGAYDVAPAKNHLLFSSDGIGCKGNLVFGEDRIVAGWKCQKKSGHLLPDL